MNDTSHAQETPPTIAHLLDLAVDSWRLCKLFERVVQKLDAGEQHKYGGRINWTMKRVAETLESLGLKLVFLEGQAFDAGLPVSALNLGDFHDDDRLIVDQTIDPAIVGPSGVVRTGTVLLRRAEQ